MLSTSLVAERNCIIFTWRLILGEAKCKLPSRSVCNLEKSCNLDRMSLSFWILLCNHCPPLLRVNLHIENIKCSIVSQWLQELELVFFVLIPTNNIVIKRFRLKRISFISNLIVKMPSLWETLFLLWKSIWNETVCNSYNDQNTSSLWQEIFAYFKRFTNITRVFYPYQYMLKLFLCFYQVEEVLILQFTENP